MEYKGYTIYADVLITQKWSFNEDEEGIIFCGDIETQEPLEENIDRFSIHDENGDDSQPLKDFYTLEQAKQFIDRHIAGLEEHHNRNNCPTYPKDAVLPNDNDDCSMCGAKLVGPNLAD
jgi:hypothetical protein